MSQLLYLEVLLQQKISEEMQVHKTWSIIAQWPYHSAIYNTQSHDQMSWVHSTET